VALQIYRKKRQFGITPEPRGRKGPSGGDQYVIQKHAARTLHYDLRLELDGVMKSWAVTKGPSLVAGEKRLAVHVEDHPIEYNSFEGTIPKGQYGGGTVMIWDRGRWIPEGDPHKGYAKGHLTFTLKGQKLKAAGISFGCESDQASMMPGCSLRRMMQPRVRRMIRTSWKKATLGGVSATMDGIARADGPSGSRTDRRRRQRPRRGSGHG